MIRGFYNDEKEAIRASIKIAQEQSQTLSIPMYNFFPEWVGDHYTDEDLAPGLSFPKGTMIMVQDMEDIGEDSSSFMINSAGQVFENQAEDNTDIPRWVQVNKKFSI